MFQVLKMIKFYIQIKPIFNIPYTQRPIKVTLHPIGQNFHGCQIVQWDPLSVKRSCPQNILVWAM